MTWTSGRLFVAGAMSLLSAACGGGVSMTKTDARADGSGAGVAEGGVGAEVAADRALDEGTDGRFATVDGVAGVDAASATIDTSLRKDVSGAGLDARDAPSELRDALVSPGLDGGEVGSAHVYASSDLLMGGMIKVGDTFYHYGTKGARNRLFIRKSRDLQTWSASYNLLPDLVTKANAQFGPGWIGFERLKIIPRADDGSFVLFVKVTGNNVGKSTIISVRFKNIDTPDYVEPAIKQLLPNEGDIDAEVTPTGAAFFMVASYNTLNQYGVFKLWNLIKPELNDFEPGSVKAYSEGAPWPAPFGIYGSHDYPREAPSLTWDPLHKQWIFLESCVNGWKPTPNYWLTADDDTGLHPEKLLSTLPAPAANLLGDSTNHYSQTTYLFHDKKNGEDYWIYMVDRYTADPAGGGNWFQMWFPAIVGKGKIEIQWGQ